MQLPHTNVLQRATRKEWIGLAVIALPCFVYSADLTMLNLALPRISEDLDPTSSQLLWIIDIYAFMVAGMLITMGTLGDKIGRRRLLLSGALAFVVASVAASFASNAGTLILSRAVLGIAGATVAPSTLSLIRNMFHHEGERTWAIGVWITSYSVGAAVGPLLGGVVLQYFPWQAIFFVGVPPMILLLLLGPRFLPEFKDPGAGRLDLIGAMLSVAAVLLIIFGVKKIAEAGTDLVYFLSIAAGVAIGYGFIYRLRKITNPLIDIGLLYGPASVSLLLVLNLMSTFTAFGIYIFLSQYLQLVLGMSPVTTGVWELPWSFSFIGGSLITPKLAQHFRKRTIMITGFLMATAGFIAFAQIPLMNKYSIFIGSVFFALGIAPVVTLLTDMVLSASPPEKAGAAGALSEVSSELGAALGIAIMGSIGAALYRLKLTAALPAGLPVSDIANTLGGTLVAARKLPATVGHILVDLSKNAFTESMVILAFIGAGITIALAVLVAATRPEKRER